MDKDTKNTKKRKREKKITITEKRKKREEKEKNHLRIKSKKAHGIATGDFWVDIQALLRCSLVAREQDTDSVGSLFTFTARLFFVLFFFFLFLIILSNFTRSLSLSLSLACMFVLMRKDSLYTA